VRKLTAVIITFNEERNIGRCLASLKDVVDEVIVSDSFSTDRTVSICKEFGVAFHQKEWEGYSAQKNHANSLAQHDWILSIDADEALSDELKGSILQAKQEGSHFNYSFNRFTNYCGKWIKHSGWYPDVKVRMFNKQETQWAGTVHETLNVKQGSVKKLKGDLLHYSYYSIDEHIAQTNKFSRLSAEELLEKGASPSIFKALFNSWLKFNKFYFIKLGILDGLAGLNIALISAYGTYLKYMKHRLLVNNGS